MRVHLCYLKPIKFPHVGSGDLGAHQHSSPAAANLPPPPSPLALAQSTLPLPKSPCTPRSMGHAIRHRFKKTYKPGKCDLCEEYMFGGGKNKEAISH